MISHRRRFSALFFMIEAIFVLFGAMSDPDCLYGTFFMVGRMCEIDEIQIPEGSSFTTHKSSSIAFCFDVSFESIKLKAFHVRFGPR